MFNKLSLKESVKKSMERNIIKLLELLDFWPVRDLEEKESRLPKRLIL